MTDTIICTAIRQPPAFYQNPPGFSVAVNLNFDCRIPESDPKGRFRAFLEALSRVRFRVYRLAFEPPPAPQPPTPAPLFLPAGWMASMGNTPSGSTPVDNVMNWLERRGKPSSGKPAPPEYWQSTAPQPGVRTLKLADLKATHHLGTAIAWPAPLPQDAGLVRVVTLTATISPPETDQRLVIVPFFDGAPPNFEPANFQQDASGLLSFTYNAGANFPNAVAEVRIIDDPVFAASNLIDSNNGFLVAPASTADAERVATILKNIENSSATLLWAFPPIYAVDWRTTDATIGRLVWRAMNGIVALLDPIVLSLIMPPPPPAPPLPPAPSGQKGPFVSALARCVEDAWGTRATPVPDTNGISRFISDGLQKRLWLRESDGEQRSMLVELIARLFKFDMTPDKLTVATATGLIPLLLSTYAQQSPDQLTKPGWFDDAKKRFGSLEAALSNELSALAQALQTDGGIEALVLMLFEETGQFDKSGNTGGALANSRCTVPAIGDEIAKAAIASFKQFLFQNLNALDAARHTQARLYELHLVAAASAQMATSTGGVSQSWTALDLTAAVKDARWFARRVDATKGGTFDNIGKALPIYAAGALTPTDRESLVGPPGPSSGGTLGMSFCRVYSDLVASGAERRFLPDHAPRSLQIQIAVDSDEKDQEDFAQTYNGLGVMLRRGGGKWAYGDLAEFDIYQNYDAAQDKDLYQLVVDPAHPDNKLITVMPLQPAAIDGQRRLFLDYDGHPFTSQAFAVTSAAGNGADANQAPFYKFEDPSGDSLSTASFAFAPALAYGESYETAAFVVGTGGALPLDLQVNGLPPWVPASATQIPPPAGSKTYSRSYLYQRTTAIGRTSLIELPKPGLAKRIGVGIEGVQPLFRDYPRVGLSSAHMGPAVLDIFRNADGTGALTLPKTGATASVSLGDLWWWGADGESGGTFTLAFFYQPGPKPENAANRTTADDPMVSLDVPIAAAVTDAVAVIEIKSEADPTDPQKVNLTFSIVFAGNRITKPPVAAPASAESIWIRVKIAASDSTKTVSLSFADPTATLSGNHVKSRPATDSLLLIAPADGTSEWRQPYTDIVNAEIMLPRVGFIDLDRWLNNNALADEAKASVRGQPPTDDDKTRYNAFFPTLMATYIGRHVDKNLPPLLDRLPDLAVDQLLIELTPLDALYAAPAQAASYTTSTSIGAISQIVPLRTLGARLKTLESTLGDPTKTVANLLALSDGCSVSLTIKSDGSDKLSVASLNDNVKDAALTVVVPRGMVARLDIRPTVPANHLENPSSAFDPRITSLATEIRAGHYIFEGTSIVIKSMLGSLASDRPATWQDRIETGDGNRCYDWESLAAEAVTVRPADAHRSYDLVANPAAIATEPTGWRWRQLGNIDIATQRWRFTGRPIYSWLDPTKGTQPSAVAIEQTWDNDKKIRRNEIINFEAETFFDRDDTDAASQTMRLNPAGETLAPG